MATNASLQGSDPTLAYDALFQMSPNGAGTIGTVSVSGYQGSSSFSGQ